MTAKQLTPDDREALETIIVDCTRVIAHTLRRQGFRGSHLADRIQGALTRLCSAVHSQRLRTTDAITSRARSCALDESRTFCRQLRREREALPMDHSADPNALTSR